MNFFYSLRSSDSKNVQSLKNKFTHHIYAINLFAAHAVYGSKQNIGHFDIRVTFYLLCVIAVMVVVRFFSILVKF